MESTETTPAIKVHYIHDADAHRQFKALVRAAGGTVVQSRRPRSQPEYYGYRLTGIDTETANRLAASLS